MAVWLDKILLGEIKNVVHATISDSKNRDDLWKLSTEIAEQITLWIQHDRTDPKYRSFIQTSAPSAVGATSDITDIRTNPDGHVDATDTDTPVTATKTRERVNLAEKLATADTASGEHDDNDNIVIDKNQMTPVWMSQNVNLSEYWIYDYSTPCTTLHGHCGGECVQTEVMLVHRRKHKLLVLDVEFATPDALHDFLGPRKELARENNIVPLEKIDAELAGREEKQRAELAAAKKQSQFNRFIEYYHQFHGDTTAIMNAMGFNNKQTVYSYKNKAKTMGLL